MPRQSPLFHIRHSGFIEIHFPIHTRVWEHHLLVRQQIICYCELFQLCGEVVGALCHRRVFHGAVREGHAAGDWFAGAFSPTAADLAESGAKLLRHGIVDDRVDGAVEVDADPAEKQEPAVQVGRVQEGVDNHQSTVWHPERGKQDHHHSQHLGHLQGNMGRCCYYDITVKHKPM